MDYSAFKELVIARAQALGLEEYELYYEESRSTSVSMFQQEMDSFSASTDGGICFRCIVDGKMGYAATESLTDTEAAAIVDRAVDNARILESEEQVFLAQGGQTYQAVTRQCPSLPQTDELIQQSMELQKKLYAQGAVDGSSSRGISEQVRIAICNSKGLELDDQTALTAYVAGAVVEAQGEKANDYQIKLGRDADLDALSKKAVDTAKQKLGGEPAPTGVYPVVFDPEAMSDLLNVYSGIFSSEAAQKGLSKLAGKEGSQIAAPCVSILDDPFHPDNPMPMPFDAEGSPTYKKYVIEKGTLTTLLYNLKTANVSGKATTGNGSKAGYDSPIGIRPFTMYLAGGQYTEEQLLDMAGNGVYINALSGLHAGANPVTGDFSLQSAGFLIENGKKTAPVKAFTVAGNFYDLLMSITATGNNVCLPAPTGMTAFGAPSVLVEKLSIAGK